MRLFESIGAPGPVINQLVSIAEFSSTMWKSTVNLIDNMDDGRGFTIGIAGFNTGDGSFLLLLEYLASIDPYHVLLEFIPALEEILKKGDSADVTGLERLPYVMRRSVGKNDKTFQRATWYAIKKLYWHPATVFCSDYDLKSQLSKYIVYDTMLQFGNLEKFRGMTLDTETEFLKEFLDIKQQVIEEDENLGDTDNNRVEMQRGLLRMKNWNLIPPFEVRCYCERFLIE